MSDILLHTEANTYSCRVAGILVRNGKVLLQKPVDDPAYAVPGGHVQLGETWEKALVREYAEETGLRIRVSTPAAFGELFFTWGNRQAHQHCSYFFVESIDEPACADGSFTGVENLESQAFSMGFHWIPVEELNTKLVYPPQVIPVIQAYADSKEKHLPPPVPATFLYRELYDNCLTYDPYDMDLHGSLVDSWLDESARRSTGMDSFREDAAYWQAEEPETYQAMVFGNPEPTAASYFFVRGQKLHIGEILISPEKRGSGIGTAVLWQLLYEIGRDCHNFTAVIYPDNEPSKRLFEKSGFVKTGVHPDGDAEYYVFHKPISTTKPFGTMDSMHKYVVIFARYKGQWLYTRKKNKQTWETAGGHIEPGETSMDAARRELWEETGAVDFTLYPVCDYHVDNTAAIPGDEASGQVFLADVRALGEMPDFEMAETCLDQRYPLWLSYPAIVTELWPVAEEKRIELMAAENRIF